MTNDLTALDQQTLGKRLRRVRLAADLDQAELAIAVGFKHPSAISRIEKGHRRLSATELDGWCRACGVSADAVFAGEPITVSLSDEVAS